jgi:predicted transcriptional regulator
MATKPPKSRQGDSKKRESSRALELRNKQMAMAAMAGKGVSEIAKDHGLARQTVSEILNGPVIEELIDEADLKLKRLITKAAQNVADKVEQGDIMTSILVLKNAGVLREKVEHEHKVVTPSIEIVRTDGTVVRMGLLKEKEK